MYCVNCGVELLQGVKFCGACGSKTSSQRTDAVESAYVDGNKSVSVKWYRRNDLQSKCFTLLIVTLSNIMFVPYAKVNGTGIFYMVDIAGWVFFCLIFVSLYLTHMKTYKPLIYILGFMLTLHMLIFGYLVFLKSESYAKITITPQAWIPIFLYALLIFFIVKDIKKTEGNISVESAAEKQSSGIPTIIVESDRVKLIRNAVLSVIVLAVVGGGLALVVERFNAPTEARQNSVPSPTSASRPAQTEPGGQQAVACEGLKVSRLVATIVAGGAPLMADFQCQDMVKSNRYASINVSTNLVGGKCYVSVQAMGIVEGNSKTCSGSREVKTITDGMVTDVELLR